MEKRKKKESRGVTLTDYDLSDKIVAIYDRIPQLRGKSPSHIASVGLAKLYKEAVENPDEIKKFLRRNPTLLDSVTQSAETDYIFVTKIVNE